ncbi:MAG: amino acid ABC transporter permease [Lachnospiraceae bacterium]|nr:amino acid ABC transporter permease [Lachnospiraceae bacterium]MBQ8878186.1 amino acid ABC transporter permease [Lachnospiraceae bacterium]
MLDITVIWKTLGRLATRVPYTITIAFVSILISTALAILLSMIKIKKVKIASALVELYLSFFRSTPGLIHILLVYYGLPLVLKPFGIILDASGKDLYSIAALSLSYAANLSEILRPAYLSIDKGQHEAALCAGLSGFQKEYRIILPQVIPIALPAMGNAFIELIKDTSILFVIGLTDIMGSAKNIITNGLGINKVEIYIAAGLIYLVITTVGNWGNHFLEIKCQKVKKHQ